MLDSQPEYLFRLARSGSSRDRQELAAAMQDMLPTPHRKMATEILMALLREAEQDLRMALAERLAPQRDCPMELIRFLVYENPVAVSSPVLRLSPMLNDAELIKILEHFAEDRAYAQVIAQRASTSSRVAEHILKKDNPEAHMLLLQNERAELNDTCMDYLVDLAKKRPELQKPLLQRKEITHDIAARLYWYVSLELRQHILEHYPVEANKLDGAINDVINQKLELRAGTFVITDDVKKRAEQLKATGGLNIKQAIEVLRKGDVPLFACMVGLTLYVRPETLLHFLLTDTNDTLSMVAHGMRLSRSEFNALFLLWRRHTMPHAVTYGQDIIAAQNAFTTVNTRDVQKIMRDWQYDVHQPVVEIMH